MDMPAISDIANSESVRVVIFINNQQVHVPLAAILKEVVAAIAALDARVTDLETP
jgi:hypothetical protein